MKLLILLSIFAGINAAVVPTLDRTPRIVGGTDADIHEFPFIVALMYYGGQQCGGSLISSYWVMTAAHCEFAISENFWIEYRTTDVETGAENVRLEPDYFIVHEDFDWNTIQHDIAVIRLKKPAVTGFHNPFVKLAAPGFYYPTRTPAVVAGWGIWSYQNFTQPTLQKLDTEIWHFKDCREAYGEFLTPDDPVIYPTNICAGLRDFSKAHCSGDSGGPLLVNGIQVGIVSWSMKPCAVAQYPGVYTSVSSYIDWITERTGVDFKMEVYMIQKS